jgi:hypothetical protein
MKPLNRRTFTKCLLTSSLIPIMHGQLPAIQIREMPPGTASVPDSIAGRELTLEERELVRKFIVSHEKEMIPLRQRDLPNSLAPGIVFASPIMHKTSGGSR